MRVDFSRTPLEIPDHPGALEICKETIASIAKKLDQVQYEQIDADLRKALATLDQTLKSADVLVKRLGDDTAPELSRTLEDARRTLKSAEGALATESPLQTDLREALREITRAAASLRALTDYLERQPQSLIRGKPAESQLMRLARAAACLALPALAACGTPPGALHAEPGGGGRRRPTGPRSASRSDQ